MGLGQSRGGESQHLVSRDEEESTQQSGYRENSVFTVPNTIPQDKEEAYKPLAISIGPLHHSKYEGMKSEKGGCLESYLKRTELAYHDFLRHIRVLEPKIRKCYKDSLPYDKDELVEIVLKDGLFILEQLLRYKEGSNVSDSGKLRDSVFRSDVMILQNQIPMFILEKMYNLSRLNNHHIFLDLVFNFFQKYNEQEIGTSEVQPVHFTDLLRTFVLPRSVRHGQAKKMESSVIATLFGANELSKRGVSFKVMENKSSLEIDFSERHRVLSMSRFKVDEHTEAYLRNLLVYEETCFRDSRYILEYMYILKLLVQRVEDAEKLIRSNIIITHFSSSPRNIAEMIDSLTNGFTIEYMRPENLSTCNRLIAFYNNPDHETMADCSSKNCSTPCKKVGCILLIVACFVGVVLFVLKQFKVI